MVLLRLTFPIAKRDAKIKKRDALASRLVYFALLPVSYFFAAMPFWIAFTTPSLLASLIVTTMPFLS
jgi:hypothetical protein